MANTNLAVASSALAQPQRDTVSPAVDVFENDDELLIVADVAGVRPDDIDVQLDNGQLTIRAARTTEVGGAPLAVEQRPCDYLRVFAVPAGTDATQIDAQLAAGVLRLRLPKPASLKPRRIEVRQG